jgi:hypothetical protein
MPYYLRYLRISWTVFCGIACVLLVVLWVASCWRFDQIVHRTSSKHVALTTVRGKIAFGALDDPTLSRVFQRDWMRLKYSMKYQDKKTGSPFPVFPVAVPDSAIFIMPRFRSPFVMRPTNSTNYDLSVPYWLLLLATTSLTAAPWLRWRFSLKMLLVAMTMVALVLRILVYFAR